MSVLGRFIIGEPDQYGLVFRAVFAFLRPLDDVGADIGLAEFAFTADADTRDGAGGVRILFLLFRRESGGGERQRERGDDEGGNELFHGNEITNADGRIGQPSFLAAIVRTKLWHWRHRP